jgi:hypothetical protein
MMSHAWKGILAVLIPLSLLPCPVVAGEPVTQAASGTRIDYVAKLNELVQKGSDESQNAEPFYQRACALCDRSVPYFDAWSWLTDWPEEQRASVRDWVKANTAALAQLRLGTKRASYWTQFQGPTIWGMDRMSYLAGVRLLVFALILQTELEATEGNTEGAAEDVLAGCRFALDVRRRLMLIEQMVGGAASNHILSTGFQVLGRCTLHPSLLQRLQKRLMELSQDPTWLIDLRGEEIATLDTLQEICVRVQAGRDKRNMEVINRILSQTWTKQNVDLETELTAEQVYSLVQGHAPEDLAGRVKKGYAYFETLLAKTPFEWKKETVDADRHWKELMGGNQLLSLMAPPVARVSELSFRMRAQRDALITTLALLRYKTDKGSFPADLQKLVSAGYTDQAPMDPYSDQPLVCKRTENNFILYSLGADFKDDGGKHDRSWGQGEQGADYVFWPIQAVAAQQR